MRKKILIGSMLVLALLLLMPSIQSNCTNITDEQIEPNVEVFTFICGKYNDISISHNSPFGRTVEFTCDKGSVLFFEVGWADHPLTGWIPYITIEKKFIWIYLEEFRGIITPNRIIGISFFGESGHYFNEGILKNE